MLFITITKELKENLKQKTKKKKNNGKLSNTVASTHMTNTSYASSLASSISLCFLRMNSLAFRLISSSAYQWRPRSSSLGQIFRGRLGSASVWSTLAFLMPRNENKEFFLAILLVLLSLRLEAASLYLLVECKAWVSKRVLGIYRNQDDISSGYDWTWYPLLFWPKITRVMYPNLWFLGLQEVTRRLPSHIKKTSTKYSNRVLATHSSSLNEEGKLENNWCTSSTEISLLFLRSYFKSKNHFVAGYWHFKGKIPSSKLIPYRI